MGVVNVTPDSFSDGGLYLDPGRRSRMAGAARRGGDPRRRWGIDAAGGGGGRRRGGAAAGRAGGRRPGRGEAAISVDTSKAAVAAAALDAGAAIVNDVTALRGDPEMAALCAERGATVVLMHMLGSPRTMQDEPRLRGRRRRGQGLPRRAGRGGGRRRHRRGADLARPGDRLRQDRRAQPGAAAAAGRAARAGAAAGDRHLAQELHRQGRRLRRGRAARRHDRLLGAGRGRGRRRSCASTTSPRSARRWPSPTAILG